MKYTITGATGNLGSKIINQLLKEVAPEELRAIVHTPAKARFLQELGVEVKMGDYHDRPSLVEAFQGTDLLIYVPSKTYDVLDRVTEMENVLAAMKTAKVKQIIFVSFFADQENNPFVMSPYYGYAPRRLATSGLEYAVVKNALYADPLVPYLPELIERKKLIYPVGNEALSFISLDDSAEAIAKLALQPDLRNACQTYLLSQSENYQMSQLGAIMTEVTGREIGYEPVTLQEFATIYAAEGDGAELASMYAAGAMGLLSTITSDFRTITGHDPQGMKDFLAENYQ